MDVTHYDDPESADAGDDGASDGLNLTPRDVAAPAKKGGAKSWGMWALLGGIVIAIAAVGYSLAGASTYFYNVDDAVAQRDDIGDKRIRLQGSVIEGSVQEGDRISFVLSFNDVDVDVVHTGEVPDLFGASIPLVIEGRFDGDTFRSDRVFVKHDETYEEDENYDERMSEAETDAQRSSASGPAADADGE